MEGSDEVYDQTAEVDNTPVKEDGFIDKRSTLVRDLFFSALAVIITAVGGSTVEWLTDNSDTITGSLPPAWAMIGGVAITLAIAGLTNLTKRYGVSKSE